MPLVPGGICNAGESGVGAGMKLKGRQGALSRWSPSEEIVNWNSNGHGGSTEDTRQVDISRICLGGGKKTKSKVNSVVSAVSE